MPAGQHKRHETTSTSIDDVGDGIMEKKRKCFVKEMIELPTETWAECFDFLDIPALGLRICLVGRQFLEVALLRLEPETNAKEDNEGKKKQQKGYVLRELRFECSNPDAKRAERKARLMVNVAVKENRNIFDIDEVEDKWEPVTIAEVPPPKCIVGFKRIKISFLDETVLDFLQLLGPLLTDSHMKVSERTRKLRKTLVHKMCEQLTGKVRSIDFEVPILFLKMHSLYREFVASVVQLNIKYEFSNLARDTPSLINWLTNRRPRATAAENAVDVRAVGDDENEQKQKEAEYYYDNADVTKLLLIDNLDTINRDCIYDFVEGIKEDFLRAKRGATFCAIVEVCEPEEFELTNVDTGEQLLIEGLPGDIGQSWHVFLRHPICADSNPRQAMEQLLLTQCDSWSKCYYGPRECIIQLELRDVVGPYLPKKEKIHYCVADEADDYGKEEKEDEEEDDKLDDEEEELEEEEHAEKKAEEEEEFEREQQEEYEEKEEEDEDEESSSSDSYSSGSSCTSDYRDSD